MRKYSDYQKDWYLRNRERLLARRKQRYAANPQAAGVINAKWRNKNKEKMKKNADRWRLQTVFGLSVPQYETMFADQADCCAICKIHQSQFNKKLAVDHCHVSGKIRGLLCGRCNTAIGLMKDSVETITQAASYVAMGGV